mmetsp:Transcript_7636/g.13370  ORF Transcript_7636/g.13370 Transcript_7636/m.13370 type:complete len:563 (-) Transcript_7636:52-1740(-)
MRGHAVKIIDIDAKGESFVLNEKALKSVLRNVPQNMKLNIISVVGAFRTGKSFILDLFLRYLRNSPSTADSCKGEPDDSWMYKGGKLEGNNNANAAESTKAKEGGFGWRSGRERCTTGIWLWSEHFIRELPGSKGEKVAVLIMDTQGMFDSTLGQHLTASIFGLSTLISSYSVYNLDKRVQEDNLQHLALFSEYGRVALVEEQKTSPEAETSEWTSSEEVAQEETGDIHRPFQRLELLVRDWQDFTDVEDLDEAHHDMRTYLGEILAERNQKDLKEVREQIKLCYETVSCWLLPHPGFEVIKKSFDGDLNKVDPDFRRLVADYVRRVFSPRMTVKKFSGRPVNSMELYNFIKTYCSLFKEARIFPEARTLLAATCEANNQNAVMSSIELYKREMGKVVGNGKPYVTEKKLKRHHKICREGAYDKFASIATMGPVASIRLHKSKLDKQIDERFADYLEANRLRDPFSFVAPFIVPIMIALMAYVARYILETVCPRRNVTCMDISDFFGSLFSTIMAFLLLYFMTQGYQVQQRVKVLFGRGPLDDDDDDDELDAPEPRVVKKNK